LGASGRPPRAHAVEPERPKGRSPRSDLDIMPRRTRSWLRRCADQTRLPGCGIRVRRCYELRAAIASNAMFVLERCVQLLRPRSCICFPQQGWREHGILRPGCLAGLPCGRARLAETLSAQPARSLLVIAASGRSHPRYREGELFSSANATQDHRGRLRTLDGRHAMISAASLRSAASSFCRGSAKTWHSRSTRVADWRRLVLAPERFDPPAG